MRNEFQTNKYHIQALKRRVNFLRTRIAALAAPSPASLTFDRAELSALQWALWQIAQAKPELRRIAFEPPRVAFEPPPIEKMAEQLQKHFAAGGGR